MKNCLFSVVFALSLSTTTLSATLDNKNEESKYQKPNGLSPVYEKKNQFPVFSSQDLPLNNGADQSRNSSPSSSNSSLYTGRAKSPDSSSNHTNCNSSLVSSAASASPLSPSSNSSTSSMLQQDSDSVLKTTRMQPIRTTFVPTLDPDQDFYGTHNNEDQQKKLKKNLLKSGQYTMFILSRHCKTNNGTKQAANDVPIVADQEAFQALKLLATVSSINAIYCGPQERCQDTAKVCAGFLNENVADKEKITVKVMEELSEQRAGVLEGADITSVASSQEFINGFKNPTKRVCDSGETCDSVIRRGIRALCYIMKHHVGQLIFIPSNRLFLYNVGAYLYSQVSGIGYAQFFDRNFPYFLKMTSSSAIMFAIRNTDMKNDTYAYICINPDPMFPAPVSLMTISNDILKTNGVLPVTLMRVKMNVDLAQKVVNNIQKSRGEVLLEQERPMSTDENTDSNTTARIDSK